MNVAVFAYNQNTTYSVYKNENILKHIICCFSSCFGIGFCTKVNIDRRMNHSKIKFVSIATSDTTTDTTTDTTSDSKTPDTVSKDYKYLTVDKYFKDFDSEVTQVTQIADNKYIFTNYKARYVLLVTI
jgi:hypothetical protein